MGGDEAVTDFPIPVLKVDSSGIVREISRAFTGEFGYLPAQVVGESVERLVPVRKRDKHVTLREQWEMAPMSRWMGSRDSNVEILDERGDCIPVRIALDTRASESVTYVYVIPKNEEHRGFNPDATFWVSCVLISIGMGTAALVPTLLEISLLLVGFGGSGLVASLTKGKYKRLR